MDLKAMSRGKVGSGSRFAALKSKLEGEGKSPEASGAIAANAGRKKYGKSAFQHMAAVGRRRAAG